MWRLRQHDPQLVWGLQYIDELVQTAINHDPADTGEDDVESYFYAVHNANFNVLGLFDDSGDIQERYEYGMPHPICSAVYRLPRAMTGLPFFDSNPADYGIHEWAEF